MEVDLDDDDDADEVGEVEDEEDFRADELPVMPVAIFPPLASAFVLSRTSLIS